MRRTACSACGGQDLDQFLDLGQSPIADAYTTTPHQPSPTFPLQVAVCAKCRLVQLLEDVDAETLFGTGYSFYSSASAPLSAYHKQYAFEIFRLHRPLAERGVVEVGCNDGDLLRHFAQFPHLGVDPAHGPAKAARERGLQVAAEPFTAASAAEIVADRGRQGIVLANHVLAHVADVHDVLAGVQTLLADDGLAFVEVQYLPDLLVNNAFDLVYHEHRNFFSLSSLEQAAGRVGLHVVDAELTDRQGGSLRATLAHRPHPNQRVDTIRASERWLDSFAAYEGMQGRAERIRSRLWDLIAAEQRAGFQVSGYGAPAKATTLFAFCGIDSDTVEYVTDTTKAKQGRYMPGTGIPIVSPRLPQYMPATRLVCAWNYLPQIMHAEGQFTIRGGRWLVPFPAPAVL